MATLHELEDEYFPGAELGDPHSQDTRLTPHVDGQPYFGAIADLLDTLTGQGDRVYITSWNLESTVKLRGGAGEPTLAQRLVTLAASKADVRLVVAVPRYSLGRQGAPLWDPDGWGQAAFSLGIGPYARQNIASVHALRAMPPTGGGPPPLENRVLVDWGGGNDSRHEKCTIVYSADTGHLHAFVGGIDYEPRRFCTPGHNLAPAGNWWHDMGVHLEGGAAASALSNFWTRWDETATLPAGRRYWYDGRSRVFNPSIAAKPAQLAPAAPAPAPPAPGGSYDDTSIRIWRSYDTVRVRTLTFSENVPWATLPATGVHEVARGLANAIDKAETYVYVEDQGINPNRFAAAYSRYDKLYPVLADACRRGVKVILVSQGYSGETGLLVGANLSYSQLLYDDVYQQLTATQQENLAVFYVRDVKVHSKLMLVDDEFLSVGSANFWDRSQLGTESELHVAVVHPGEENSFVADVRVQLWREHLRLTAGPVVDGTLRDLSQSLGCFRDSWGTGVPAPNSAFVEVTP
jgi:phosphatidylserine/phosphatidylglycerophosphate/cardiolipin synthase-like enzyme